MVYDKDWGQLGHSIVFSTTYIVILLLVYYTLYSGSPVEIGILEGLQEICSHVSSQIQSELGDCIERSTNMQELTLVSASVLFALVDTNPRDSHIDLYMRVEAFCIKNCDSM